MNDSDCTLRAATAADDSDWARLRHALWPDCPPERHAVEAELYRQSPGIVALALDATGHAIGFAEVTIRHEHVPGTTACPVPYLEGWYVDADWRGRNVGRALIDFVTTWARKAGFREIASDVELDNRASQAAHGRLGFREVGRTVQYVKTLDSIDP